MRKTYIHARAKPLIATHGAVNKDLLALIKIMWLPLCYDPWASSGNTADLDTIDVHSSGAATEEYRRRTLLIKSRLAYIVLLTMGVHNEDIVSGELMAGFAEHVRRLKIISDESEMNRCAKELTTVFEIVDRRFELSCVPEYCWHLGRAKHVLRFWHGDVGVPVHCNVLIATSDCLKSWQYG
jgi:hypothetical protein